MISQLYEQHVKISDTAECDISSEEDLRFRDQAVFSNDYAYHIKNETVLSVDELLLIFQDRTTVAKLPSCHDSSSLYFMPSLLEEFTEEELTASRSNLLLNFQSLHLCWYLSPLLRFLQVSFALSYLIRPLPVSARSLTWIVPPSCIGTSSPSLSASAQALLVYSHSVQHGKDFLHHSLLPLLSLYLDQCIGITSEPFITSDTSTQGRLTDKLMTCCS